MKQIIILFIVLSSYSGYSQFNSFIDSCNQKAKQYNKVDKKKLNQGLWVYFVYRNPEIHSMHVTYGFYHNDIPIGVWQTKDEKARLLEEYIYFDTLHKKVQHTQYYMNGNPQLLRYLSLTKLSIPDTIEKFDLKSKEKTKIIYQRLMNKGKCVYYYENGKIQSEGFYVEDKRDGVWRHYNIEGMLVKEEFYEKGLLKTSK
jgi:antitoxin component YwqK of YwqJK toxin-antitoxin module